MGASHIAGLAVGVVKKRRVVYLRGFGFRHTQEELPVTPATLFAIGSTTKAFTATAAGMLVDEGKLDLDQPVRRYLPWFRLKDPVVTERITTRDLLCHRSGLPGHDLVWYGANVSRRELVERARYLEPTADFRECFQYQNIMYSAAGQVIEAASGMPWEDFVRQRIFAPLGMASANFSVRDSQKASDFSRGYRWTGNRFTPVPFLDAPSVGPAGMINASAADMCKWLILNLGKGSYRGKTIVSEGMLREIHAPHTILRWTPKELPSLSAYALGWLVLNHRGREWVGHGGGSRGFSALVAMIPEAEIGFVFLSNADPTQGVDGLDLCAHVFDRLLGLRPLRERRQSSAQARSRPAASARLVTASGEPGTAPGRPLRVADCIGEYRHLAYGHLRIDGKGGRLRAHLNNLSFALHQEEGPCFSARPPLFHRNTRFVFGTDTLGRVSSVAAMLEPNHEDLAVLFRRTRQ